MTVFAAMLEELRRLHCAVLHWRRERDSYGNRCRTCGRYW